MKCTLTPLLAIALLGTSGCVAAAIGVAGAGAGLAYEQSKASDTQVKKSSQQLGKESGGSKPTQGTRRPEPLVLSPAPADFVDCKMSNGATVATSSAECGARGGTTL